MKKTIEYAALTQPNTDVSSLSEGTIEYRSEAEYIKAKLKKNLLHYPQPIIYTTEDLKLLDKGKK